MTNNAALTINSDYWPCITVKYPTTVSFDMAEAYTWLKNNNVQYKIVSYSRKSSYYVYIQDPKHMVMFKLKFASICDTSPSLEERQEMFKTSMQQVLASSVTSP